MVGAGRGGGVSCRLLTVKVYLSTSLCPSISIHLVQSINYDAQATHQLSTTRIVVLKNELKTAQCQQKIKTRIK